MAIASHDYVIDFGIDSAPDIIAAGSGNSYWETYKQSLTVPADILDAYLFVTNLDKSSSTRYDVYSLEENKLVKNINPTDEMIQEAEGDWCEY